MLSVGERSVRHAREVLDEGAQELIEAVDSGKAAMSAAAARYAAENGCVLHQAREVGELENYSFLHRLICLRFPGETECLWFVQERFRSDARL
jgi:hypothetical protein